MAIIYNDISSKDIGVAMFVDTWQALPLLKNSYIEITGKSGVYDYGCQVQPKNIVVNCSVHQSEKFSDLINKIDKMINWLNPLNGSKKLVLPEIPDRYYMARISEQIDAPKLIRNISNFIITFVCTDPYSYAIKDEIFYLSGNETIIRKQGNASSKPVYRIKANIQNNESLTIDTNGNAMILNGILNQEEILLIDSQNLTAKILNPEGKVLRSGIENLSTFNFPELNVGENEIIVTSNGANFENLEIESKSRWL